MTSYKPLRDAVEAARVHGRGIDPDHVLRLITALENVEPELLLLRSIVSDLDVFFDSEEGDLFVKGHDCRVQRRLAQFWREQYKPNAAQRGHQRPSVTYGRGRGAAMRLSHPHGRMDAWRDAGF